MELLAHAAMIAAVELGLLAAVIFALFGTEDIAFDALWLAGLGDRGAAPHPPRADAPVRSPVHRMAVAIGAWDESAVIGAMLTALASRWAGAPIRVYVGVYANDLGTMIAASRAAAADPRIRLVINGENGPTTKGGCLNRIWQAIARDARSGEFVADALLIHDAEDLVDPAEIEVLAAALGQADYAQLPVIPLIDADSRWIGSHYCDEFAESHGKEMVVRSALGAPLPTAGVGCAFRMDALRAIAGPNGPFDADCLTEDYELGMRLSAAGAQGRFVREWRGGAPVASRAFFPHRLDSSVAQKTRWLRGIALDGWDRLGWITRPDAQGAERMVDWWMQWRDRRSVLTAAAVLTGYMAVLLGSAALTTGTAANLSPAMRWLLLFNAGLLIWRLAMRALHTGLAQGWRHAPMAVPRQLVSNIILVMTAWRALLAYGRGRRGGALIWTKTAHRFPQAVTERAR